MVTEKPYQKRVKRVPSLCVCIINRCQAGCSPIASSRCTLAVELACESCRVSSPLVDTQYRDSEEHQFESDTLLFGVRSDVVVGCLT